MKKKILGFSSMNLGRMLSFGATAFALAVLPACSDDSPEAPATGGEEDEPEVELNTGTVSLNVYTDAKSAGVSIENYWPNNGLFRGIDGIDEVKAPKLDNEPSVPADAVELTPVTDEWFASDIQGNAVIKNAGKYRVKMNSSNSILYVDATGVELIFSETNNGPKVIVKSDASVVFNPSTISYYPVHGVPMFNNVDVTVYGDATYPKDLVINKGSLKVKSIDIEGQLSLENDPTLVSETYINVGSDFEIKTQSRIHTGCIEVGGTLTIDNVAKNAIAHSVTAKNLVIRSSNAQILLGDKAVIDVEETITVENKPVKIMSTGDKAGIKAKKFVGYLDISNDHYTLNNFFAGNVIFDKDMEIFCSHCNKAIEFEKIEGAETFEQGTVIVKDGGEAACKKLGTEKQKPVPPVVPEIIGSTGIDHTHPISATCIDVYGDKAYLSWHKRGAGQVDQTSMMHGCIETLAYNAAENTIGLVSWMETKNAAAGASEDDAYDFNHLAYDATTNTLLTVGEHPKKGGFIAQINLPQAEQGNGLNVMTARELPQGISGNAIAIDNSRNILVAAAGGYYQASFDVFKKNEKPKQYGVWVKSPVQLMETAGSAKHVATNGVNVASIEFTNRYDGEYNENDVTTTLDAKVSCSPLGDSWFKGETWTVDVPAFAPIYGKDVIAIDTDNTVYSCQGRNGVAVYKNGAETARFVLPQWAENTYNTTHDVKFNGPALNVFRTSAANGLCISDNNLYIAYGGAGVWVLDKTTLEVKSWYTAGGASANYVKVDDKGICYVAYGRSGAKVLKFGL